MKKLILLLVTFTVIHRIFALAHKIHVNKKKIEAIETVCSKIF